MWVEEASTVDISHITRFFTNQQYDKESGLYYYNARYYDPHLGSFITPDPAMEDFNHYTYCAGNPITYTDPTGMFKTKQFVLGLLQIGGGVSETKASIGLIGVGVLTSEEGVGTAGIVVGLIGLVDGQRNIIEGLLKSALGAADKDFQGIIPEIIGAIKENNGKSKEEVEKAKKNASRLETFIDGFMPGRPLWSGASLLTDVIVKDDKDKNIKSTNKEVKDQAKKDIQGDNSKQNLNNKQDPKNTDQNTKKSDENKLSNDTSKNDDEETKTTSSMDFY